MSSDLFTKALLACFDNYAGRSDENGLKTGALIDGILTYDYYMAWEGHPEEHFPYSIHPYLNNNSVQWPRYDLTVRDQVIANALDTLYVGGGSGRWAKYIESQTHELNRPRVCHSIDISPDAIELMSKKSVSNELMDAYAMTFADNSYELVVVAPGVMDTAPDAQGLIDDVARIASQRVILSGWSPSVKPEDSQEAAAWLQAGGEDPVDITERIVWNGETQVYQSKAYHDAHAERMIDAAGLTMVTKVIFKAEDNRPECSWVCVAGH